MAQRLNAQAAQVFFLGHGNYFLAKAAGRSSVSFERSGMFL